MNRMFGLVTVALLWGALGGCVSWASYPAQPGEAAVKNPNDPAIIDVIHTSMSWVISKYPPSTQPTARTDAAQLAVNLPPGIRARIYQGLADRIGHGAVPLSQESKGLPTYHIAQVRIRGDEAAVDILRPVVELGASPEGGPVYQEIRVNLRGGMQPWRVMSHREWTPGVVARMPDLHYIDSPVKSAEAPGGS